MNTKYRYFIRLFHLLTVAYGMQIS